MDRVTTDSRSITTHHRSWSIDMEPDENGKPATLADLNAVVSAASAMYRRDTGKPIGERADWLQVTAIGSRLTFTYTIQTETA